MNINDFEVGKRYWFSAKNGLYCIGTVSKIYDDFLRFRNVCEEDFPELEGEYYPDIDTNVFKGIDIDRLFMADFLCEAKEVSPHLPLLKENGYCSVITAKLYYKNL